VTEIDGRISVGPQWDPAHDGQVRILVGHGSTHDSVVIGIGHVLSDGHGLLQYLSLLQAAYGGDHLSGHNVRDIGPLLANLRVRARTAAERIGRRLPRLQLDVAGDGSARSCRTVVLPDTVMKPLHEKARRHGVSLNDAFLAAYARVVCSLLGVKTVSLPCPADLRRFGDIGPMSIANLTGMFRVTVSVGSRDSFTDTAKQVHGEMRELRARNRCFAGVANLRRVSRVTPPGLTAAIIRRTYTIMAISYTNLGMMDRAKTRFADTPVISAFLTGTYRMTPEFQLSVSSFGDTTTFACTLVGDERRAQAGEQVLRLVAEECSGWLLAED
jgi:NRPS condensation-like uncharacterized protein